MKKISTYVLILTLITNLTVSAAEYGVAYRVHDMEGQRVGTVKRDLPNSSVICLFDMNGKKVKNPAQYMKQPANECYLFDVDGIAIGKCTATRVIVWGR